LNGDWTRRRSVDCVSLIHRCNKCWGLVSTFNSKRGTTSIKAFGFRGICWAKTVGIVGGTRSIGTLRSNTSSKWNSRTVGSNSTNSIDAFSQTSWAGVTSMIRTIGVVCLTRPVWASLWKKFSATFQKRAKTERTLARTIRTNNSLTVTIDC